MNLITFFQFHLSSFTSLNWTRADPSKSVVYLSTDAYSLDDPACQDHKTSRHVSLKAQTKNPLSICIRWESALTLIITHSATCIRILLLNNVIQWDTVGCTNAETSLRTATRYLIVAHHILYIGYLPIHTYTQCPDCILRFQVTIFFLFFFRLSVTAAVFCTCPFRTWYGHFNDARLFDINFYAVVPPEVVLF